MYLLIVILSDIFVATGAILPELILYIVGNFYAPEFMCRMVKYMQVSWFYFHIQFASTKSKNF